MSNLKRITALLEEADAVISELSLNAHNALLDFHTGSHNVVHCVRWGAQNAREALDDVTWETE